VSQRETGGSVILVHARDLLFSSRIGETALRLGLPFRAARTLDDLRRGLGEKPGLVLLDLTASDLDMGAALDAVDAAGRPAPVLAWTTHTLWKTTRPLHDRCDRVVTREALTAELPDLLTRYLGPPR
jgi:hypothetical protein